MGNDDPCGRSDLGSGGARARSEHRGARARWAHLAGPGTASIAVADTETVSADGDRDACVTVVNSGRAAVQVLAVGASSPTIAVQPGDSAGLCVLALDHVDLTCTGTTACTAQWRVDDN